MKQILQNLSLTAVEGPYLIAKVASHVKPQSISSVMNAEEVAQRRLYKALTQPQETCRVAPTKFRQRSAKLMGI